MPIIFFGYNFFENLRDINKFTINGVHLYFAINSFLIINAVLCYSILHHFLYLVIYLCSHKNWNAEDLPLALFIGK